MTDSGGIVDPVEAKVWLEELRGIRVRTHRDRRACWFPLLVLGALVLGAAPFYALAVSGSGAVVAVGKAPTTTYFPVGVFNSAPTSIAVYWLVAGPLAYLVTALFYRQRALRRGLAASPTAYLVTGLALFGLLAVAAATHLITPNDFTARGLLPLVVVALGVFVLARVERSRAVFAAAVPLLGLALVANLYDMENLFPRLGIGDGIGSGQQTNVVIVGAALVLAATVLGLGTRPASRHGE